MEEQNNILKQFDKLIEYEKRTGNIVWIGKNAFLTGGTLHVDSITPDPAPEESHNLRNH